MTAVSIIIPARNAEATLGRTLDSVAAQEFTDIEAIVVDDGSSDGTAGIVAGWSRDDARIRLVSGPAEGLAAARNEGLRQARGVAVLFLDADDWIARDHLRRLHAGLRQEREAIASYCGYVRVTPEGQAFMPRLARGLTLDPIQELVHRNPLAAHSLLVLRQRVSEVGDFDSSLRTCEDWDLWQRLAFAGGRFALVPELYAYYGLGPDSLSNNVTQLFCDAATVIGRGFAELGDICNPGGQQPQGKEMALAYFGLWCRVVATAQGQPFQNLPPLPKLSPKAEGIWFTASMLLEGLCTGACRTPASFARNWPETSAMLDRAMKQGVVSGARAEIKKSIANMLGVDPKQPSELVSAVIPAYKAMDTLGETLCSVRHQTHRTLDIIVVDDGSPDATPEMVLQEAAEDPRISLIQQTNAGVAAARNRGWRAAASDLIAFVDSDDLWAPTKIERQLEALKAEGEEAGLAYTWYAKLDADSFIISTNFRPRISGRVLDDIFAGNFVGNGSAPLIRRAALEEAGGFDSSLHERGAQGCEDFSIYFRIAERYRFALVPEPLTGYRDLAGNMSSDMVRMVRSFDLVGKEMLSRHPCHRRAINRGQNGFMLWSLITAAERGDISSVGKLMGEMGRRAPVHLAGALSYRLPRALIRGVRLRLMGKRRRRKDYRPRRFIIGRDGLTGGETMGA